MVRHESPTRLAYRRKWAKTHPDKVLAQRLRTAVNLLERYKVLPSAEAELTRLAIMAREVEVA